MAEASVLDAAGPSTSTEAELQQEVQLAEANFKKGIQAIKANDLDQAVDLFGQVLQTRCQQYGAQDEQDVFGASLQAATAQEDPEAVEEESSEDEKENVDDKGKKPMREENLPQAQDAEEDEEGDDSPGSRTDMELAWENLEVAKLIYERDPQSSYAKELADIHSLLADIGMEQESFESALQDQKRALELLSGILKADDRRLAELHYKMSLTLQYLDQPEDSLKAIKTAVKLVETRIDNIKAAQAGTVSQPQAEQQQEASASGTSAVGSKASEQAEATGSAAPAQAASEATTSSAAADGATVSAGEPSIEAAQQELEDLQAVLEDMYDKVDELKQVLKEYLSTKNSIKAAFSQVAGSLGPFQAGQGSSTGAGPSAPAPVVDLGVVGRGTKRVTPMPLSTSTAGPSTAPPARAGPQKRSLEDLMNGGAVNGAEPSSGFGSSAGTTSIGFGSSVSGSSQVPTAKAPWPAAPVVSKRAKTEFAEKSTNSNVTDQTQAAAKAPAAKPALPAFLQPANVTATYGSKPTSSKD